MEAGYPYEEGVAAADLEYLWVGDKATNPVCPQVGTKQQLAAGTAGHRQGAQNPLPSLQKSLSWKAGHQRGEGFMLI